MRRCIVTLALLAGVVIAAGLAVRQQTLAQTPAVAGTSTAPNDVEAIVKSAQAFAAAFNKGDARAIAAMWTENGESREAGGQTFIGRAAIEKAYIALFQAKPGGKMEVRVKSVRFPATDLAVEEGVLLYSRRAKDLPTTSAYVAIHVREGKRWRIALASEGGPDQDRLEQLDWLLGEWTTKVKDDTVKLTFKRDPKKQVMGAKFTRTAPGKKPVGGSIRIALDPETGQIRSWGFEDDGAHSQALWFCDGKSWILDMRGVLADGTSTAERIILQRVAPDSITWRAVDRVLGDNPLPDTPPMRLTHTTAVKQTGGGTN
jgi:uncharacterized protein (TIGR02246 family)